MQRARTRTALAAGVLLSFVLVCAVPLQAEAAPPRKDICPAPESHAARQEAVAAACEYFDMASQSWGVHSAFGAAGQVINCIHFSCQSRAALREDCLDFDPTRLQVRSDNGRWLLTDGRSRMQLFENRSEAIRSLDVIKRYGMNKRCFVGRPSPVMEYWLAGSQAPSGAMSNEDCLAFSPARLRLRQDGNRWLMTDGRSRLRLFPNREQAAQALSIIRKYGFDQTCYIGRPDPAMTYFRQ